MSSMHDTAKRTDQRPASGGHRLLIVCSSGGHLMQMVQLEDAWGAFERLWITFDKPDARSLLRDERVIFAHGPTNRNIPNLLRNLRLAADVIRREKPSAILTTGAGVAVPFAWMGRAAGIPTFYVESFTRMAELSLSARLIEPVARRIYVQWPELARDDRHKWHFAGNLFAG